MKRLPAHGRWLAAAVVALAVVALGVVSPGSPAAHADTNVDFLGHWTPDSGYGWTVTSQDAGGGCTGTTDLASSGYDFVNCQVSGSSYAFDITFGDDYVSHNTGTITGNDLVGEFNDGRGDNPYTAHRDGATVDAADTAVAEPASGTVEADVPVTLSAAQDSEVSVSYATQDGTATTGHGDYDAASGTLTFAPGQTTATVPVTVEASGLTEDRTFSVVLSSVSGGSAVSLGRSTATVTISDKATIGGSVTARPGRPVAGVPVLVADGDTSVTATTDSGGRFTALVPPGTYTVTPQPGDGRYVPTVGGDCVAAGAAACSTTVHAGGTAADDFTAALGVDSVALTQPTIGIDGSQGALAAVPDPGTYDGNTVTVTVTVSNTAATPLTTGVALGRPALAGDDSAPAMTGVTGLPGSVTVPAHGTVTVTGQWDTSGAAWKAGSTPDPTHVVRATLGATPSTYDQTTVTVRPKPAVLVHGLNSDASTWSAYQDLGGFLHQANPVWQGFAVGDGTVPGVMHTELFSGDTGSIADNATEEARYIRGVRALTGAEHVDLVAHSMGGLISRQYINSLMPADPPDGRPVVDHLVMLGTPNEGSPCAYGAELINILGGAGTTDSTHIGLAVTQLEPTFLADFNASVTARKGVAFSLLAGHSVPTTCGAPGWGDEVVPVTSALWNLTDTTVVPGLLHTDMTASSYAFTSWVLPHLAVSGSGGAAPADRAAAARFGARSDARASVSRVCRPQTGGLDGVVTAGSATVGPKRKLVHLQVPAGKRLEVTLVHADTVGAVLKGPRGSAKLVSGSARAAGPVSSLAVAHPRAGRWTLTLTSATARPVGWSVTEPGAKARLATTVLTGRHGVRGVRAVVKGLGSSTARHLVVQATLVRGHHRRVVRMQAAPGHPGVFTATVPHRLAKAGLQVVTTARGGGVRLTALDSASGCAR